MAERKIEREDQPPIRETQSLLKKTLIQAGISRKASSRVPIFVKFPITQPRPKYVIMIVVVTAGKRASKSGLEAEARFTLARPRDRRLEGIE
ncbi:hypothetical protein HZH66_013492 [Vespula vulgaris]|uniref:Uncharacterized protein n=1 Tax=Vespula vulgaris TaxID=7454 RepID=A0A834J5V5_VESVU|nr:hypothetical protein HZH66_013492 [Vespula vulgaris]